MPWQYKPVDIHLAVVLNAAIICKILELTIGMPQWWPFMWGVISMATIPWGTPIQWVYRQAFLEDMRKQEAERRKHDEPQ